MSILKVALQKALLHPKTNYERFGRARLLKLAIHLEIGQLGHKVFDFGKYNGGNESSIYDKSGCATNGCAIGELPILFPTLWKFEQINDEFGYAPVLISFDTDDIDSCSHQQHMACVFFGVTKTEADGLFLPHMDRAWAVMGKILNRHSTRSEVADSIFAFLEYKDRNSTAWFQLMTRHLA